MPWPIAANRNTACSGQSVSYIYEYSFPVQESKLRAGNACVLASDGKTGFQIDSIDYDRQILAIKRGKQSGPLPDRMSACPTEIVVHKMH